MDLHTKEQRSKILEQVLTQIVYLNRSERKLKMEYDLYFKQTKQVWVLYIGGKLMYEDENLLKVLAELDRILKDSE